MKRLTKIVLASAMSLIVAAAVAVWLVSRSGSGAIEKWVGGQLQLIAGWYLNPKLSFEDLDYQYPGTIRLKNLKLTADDPAHADKTLDVFGAEGVLIELAEVPQVGQPIKIEKIILTRPLFQAVPVAPDSRKLVGFSNLLRSDGDQKPREPQPQGTKLSEVFQMRLVELIDGRIVYDPRVEGTPAMELDQINTRLDIQPDSGGWYGLKTVITRKPVFDLSVAGRLNLDAFEADQLVLDLKSALGREQDQHLPPQLQKLLKDHEVQGALDLKLTGSLPIRNYRKGNLQAQMTLTQANISAGAYRVPIEKLSCSAKLQDGKATMPDLQLIARHGRADASASVALDGLMDADLKIKVIDMLLEDAVRESAADASQLAGRLNADFAAVAPLAVVLAKSFPSSQPVAEASAALPEKWGRGSIRINDGRLVHLPVISHLGDAVGKPMGMMGGGSDVAKPSDYAKVVFDLAGDAARLSEITLVSSWFAVHGDGRITLDRKLDLTVNGGPVERVERALGKDIGGAIASVTDKFVAYRITGTVGDPKVAVEVAGGDVGKTVGEGADQVGKGIKGIGNIIKDATK